MRIEKVGASLKEYFEGNEFLKTVMNIVEYVIYVCVGLGILNVIATLGGFISAVLTYLFILLAFFAFAAKKYLALIILFGGQALISLVEFIKILANRVSVMGLSYGGYFSWEYFLAMVVFGLLIWLSVVLYIKSLPPKPVYTQPYNPMPGQPVPPQYPPYTQQVPQQPYNPVGQQYAPPAPQQPYVPQQPAAPVPPQYAPSVYPVPPLAQDQPTMAPVYNSPVAPVVPAAPVAEKTVPVQEDIQTVAPVIPQAPVEAPVAPVIAPAPEAEAQAEAKTCPNCGAQCAPGTAFCTSCGTKLN